MPKNKCKWNKTIQESHPYLRKGNTESTAFCSICNCMFSIAAGGNNDVERHKASEKHTKLARAAAGTSVRAHFSSTIDSKRAAQEGAWAYHVVNSNHSFASSDCASKMLRECFGIKKIHLLTN